MEIRNEEIVKIGNKFKSLDDGDVYQVVGIAEVVGGKVINKQSIEGLKVPFVKLIIDYVDECEGYSLNDVEDGEKFVFTRMNDNGYIFAGYLSEFDMYFDTKGEQK